MTTKNETPQMYLAESLTWKKGRSMTRHMSSRAQIRHRIRAHIHAVGRTIAGK